MGVHVCSQLLIMRAQSKNQAATATMTYQATPLTSFPLGPSVQAVYMIGAVSHLIETSTSTGMSPIPETFTR